jgi:SSS family solute:Na+ symporter
MTVTQVIIILFGLLYFGVVVYTRKKGNFEEFSVAGRSMGTFLIFSSLCATYVGPGWTLGLVREGFSSGLFSLVIAPTAGIGIILVAIFLVPTIRTKFSDSFSIGDIVGGANSHNHRVVQIMAGIINVLILSSVVVAMSYAGGELINNVFGFSKVVSIAIMTAMVTLYSLYGGIRASIQTDAIQFIHFLILIPVLVLLLVFSESFEWSAYTSFVSQTTKVAFNTSDFTIIIGTGLIYLLGNIGLDGSSINRFLSSKDERVAKKAALYSGGFIFFWLMLMVLIGSIAAYLYPNMENSDQILLFVAEKQFPSIMYGIFIIAMIGVIMSTQDSLINGAGVSFSQDILEGINPKITDAKKLLYSKLYTVGLGAVAIIVASFLDSVLNTLIAQFEIYIPVMVPLVFFAIVKKRPFWQSAIVGPIGGFVGFILWKSLGETAIPPIAIGLLSNCVCYLLADRYFKTRNLNNQAN